MRLLAMEPGTHRSYGPNGGPSGGQLFDSHASERLRILGEIPLRKFGPGGTPILDPDGNPDTSFLAKIPADTPFTFQMIDRNGLALAMAQTWHQLRPGEVRNDCGGCHAHSRQPLPWAQTYAARADYPVVDLSKSTPLVTRDAGGNPTLRTVSTPVVDVEFYRDIRPLLTRSCVSCHTGSNPSPPGNLVLDDTADHAGLPGDYLRLADDPDATWGYPPVIGLKAWRQSNASRYIRAFQSRRSLLVWKVFGARLDGWTNADHPTESTPGDPATLPAGADPNTADLDYTGTIMPPPGSGVPPLTIDEKMLIARWIDLGAPINSGGTSYGWFLDEIRPALEVSLPRPNANPGPLDTIRVGVADAHGIAPGTLSITASFAVAGRPAGQELADLAAAVDDGVYAIAFAPPLTDLAVGHVYARVADTQGNIARVDRRFSVGQAPPSPTTTTTTLPPAGPCPPAPTSCGGAATSSIVLTAAPRLGWSWTGAQALPAGDLGDPTSGTTGYQLCVYDGAATLVMSAAVSGGGQCGASPCWRALAAGGFRYKDATGTSAGVVGVTLKPGAARPGRIGVRGKGSHLALPALPLASGGGVTVELRRRDDPARCWAATFPASQRNTAKVYRARLPKSGASG